METSTQHPVTGILLAGLFALAAVVAAPAAAQASRLPADPMTYVGTPASLARAVIDSQATNVWAALEDIRSE
jgi:hypothetical protein